MRLTTPLRWLVALAMLVVARTAVAQNPVRLPAIQSIAPLEKPHAHALIGIVRDTTAIVLQGAEVSIVDLKLRVLTNDDGKFRFDDIKPGSYDVRVRRVGFAPQVRTIVVDADGGVGEFVLVPIPRSLQPVVINAARGGLTGIVGDTAFHAIPGATVRILGTGHTTQTDSAGHFAFDVRAGQYFMSVVRAGFDDQTLMVRVPRDSGRHVAFYLAPHSGKTNPRSAHNMDDLVSRMASRMTTNSTIYSPEDLESMGVTWVGDAIQNAVTRTSERTYHADTDCYAVLNGGPDVISLKGLTRDDIVSMEVYPTNGMPLPIASGLTSRPSRASHYAGTRITGLTNAGPAATANFYTLKNCPTIYIWKR